MATTISAEDILDRSIADIKRGGWICGTLCDGERRSATVPKCAIGLVSFHEKGYAYYPMESGRRGGKQMRRVLDALVDSIPKTVLRQMTAEKGTSSAAVKLLGGEALSYKEKENLVIDRNDFHTVAGVASLDAKTAGAWFRKARKLLEVPS